MKTTFDKSTRDELIRRIDSLNEHSTALWGKMNAYQMVRHCSLWEGMISGKIQYKRVLAGRLFGQIALREVLKDEKPLRAGSPTIPELKITDNGDVLSEKAKWIPLIEAHAHFSNNDIIHPFFGKMTKEQVGFLSYKHIDHHLRQFGC